MENENARGSFGSNLGFIMSAIGSAVGLGNIWGFPYKMGKCGGFTFLIVYIILAVVAGFAIMLGEFSIGRKTGCGPVNAYKRLSKKFKWLGWLAIISAFLLLCFYPVLGGYCIYYIIINFIGIFGGMPDSSSLGTMLASPAISIGVMVLFMLICWVVNCNGIDGGIEKFNVYGMPALFILLVIVIIRAWTLPNAAEGLRYMFVPGYAVSAGFIEESPNLISVIATAGGQLFFSLSLAMGAMITYGSYLDRNENLPKNSVIVVVADTFAALMAGLAVIPAAVANGINNGVALNDIKLGGPSLLFETLQDVFHDMGAIGGVFGVLFYILVLIAAVSSAISVIEAICVTFIDSASAKGHEPKRKRTVTIVCGILTVICAFVAWDGMGSNGFAPYQVLDVAKKGWSDCWLDFVDMLAEGVAMPLGALFMSIMIGWELKPKSLFDEIDRGYTGNAGALHGFWSFCVRYICPLVMFLIFLSQMNDFFSLGIFNG